jgi:hydroxymethylpyrimidine pyrophosphatase-like HAD family hydrolase
VLAAGDGDNDRAMLRWAGHGVAMGQAPAEVKADADEVTATVVDDGLALVLERWF